MDFIRSDDGFRFLCNFTGFLRREQFRADRRIQDIQQAVGQLLLTVSRSPVCFIADDVAHQGFRHTGIDAVHAHVVPVIGGPAQGKLAQVAGSHHQPGKLVCFIHEHQGADSGLCILEGYIQILRIMVNIFKVLQHRIFYIDLAEGDTQFLA